MFVKTWSVAECQNKNRICSIKLIFLCLSLMDIRSFPSSKSSFFILSKHFICVCQKYFIYKHLFYLPTCCNTVVVSIYLPSYLLVVVSIYLPSYLPVVVSIYIPIYLAIYLLLCLSIYLTIYLLLCLSIYLAIYLLLCLSICKPVVVSIYHPPVV